MFATANLNNVKQSEQDRSSFQNILNISSFTDPAQLLQGNTSNNPNSNQTPIVTN